MGSSGGGCQQGLLRQCDMAHAINSGSAEGPCLAICSGSGAFEKGRRHIHPLPQPPPRSRTHRHREPRPPLSSSPGRHPTRPAHISIKQLHGNLLPCRVGGAPTATEQWLASLNNRVSDEKALGELDIHYKRGAPR